MIKSEKLFFYLIAGAFLWLLPELTGAAFTGTLLSKTFSIIAASIAFLLVVEWLFSLYQRMKREAAEVAAITPARKLIQAASQLSPAAQLEISSKLASMGFEWESLMFRVGDHVSFAPSIPDSSVPNGRIPGDFIRVFMELSTHRFTPALSTWHHETRNRQYADALLKRFVQAGLVDYPKTNEGIYAGGNRPAKWRKDEKGESYYWRVLYGWAGVLYRELPNPEINPFKEHYEKISGENQHANT